MRAVASTAVAATTSGRSNGASTSTIYTTSPASPAAASHENIDEDTGESDEYRDLTNPGFPYRKRGLEIFGMEFDRERDFASNGLRHLCVTLNAGHLNEHHPPGKADYNYNFDRLINISDETRLSLDHSRRNR